MALLTAAATSSLFALLKVSVSTPWRNSAWGWAGEPAKAARTEARTPAWRKSGTGWVVAAPARLTVTVCPGTSHFAPLPIMPGRSELGVCGAGGGVVLGTGRGAVRGLGLLTAREVAGARAGVGAGCAADDGGGEGLSRTVAHPAGRTAAAQRRAMRVLLAMVMNLSCSP